MDKKIICVTNRKLCKKDFLFQMKKIIDGNPDRIIVREKDLSGEKLEELVLQIYRLCQGKRTSLYLHSDFETARRLEIMKIQLSFQLFKEKRDLIYPDFQVGVSVHSLEEAKEAESLGAEYVIAGHIFETSCKQNLPPRGLGFLNEICQNVSLPVFAIGGISKDNFTKVIEAGAAGACLMSSLMEADNPKELLNQI
ncbi:thiamine phosphate synthase [Anaeromicropila populeti]|uniref:Thiamine-phosphate pyrophosphorylase n=1 Tax=Anaeromicropila populeti TaxID=37658 RepID=A0A1I6KK91_9FIRM|nr:thiamine phosphate synthase [Anaeromicropila populeti]SFR91574.1 thiamine-phosphate pyrophosphorylase [Anaeromicropila populeti]